MTRTHFLYVRVFNWPTSELHHVMPGPKSSQCTTFGDWWNRIFYRLDILSVTQCQSSGEV